MIPGRSMPRRWPTAAEVATVMAVLEDGPMTTSQVIRSAGIDRDYALRSLRALARKGSIVKTSGGWMWRRSP